MKGEERLAWIDSQMRTLQQLAGTITTSVANLEPTEIILKQIEEAARAVLVMENLVRVNRDLVGSPARSLIVGKRGTITASQVSEGSSIPKLNPTYTPATITPVKYGVGVEITYEAIQSFHFDLINDWLKEAGYAMAKAKDSAILSEFYDTTTYSNIGSVDAATSGVLAYDDVISAVTWIRANNFDPDTLVIHPNQAADLLKDTKFITYQAYGSREPILNGEIGQFSGVKVFVTTQATDGKALVFDKKRAGILVYKRPLTVRRREEPERDAITIYVTEMYKAAILNEKAVCIIHNC